MGLWFMPPPGMTPSMVAYEKDNDLEAVLVEGITNKDHQNMILQNAASLRHISLDASHYHPRTKYTDNLDMPLTDEQWDAAAKKIGMGRWISMGTAYGSASIRNAHLEIIKQEMTKVPGSRWFLLEDRKEKFRSLHSCADTMRGLPTLDEFRWLDQKSAMRQYAMAKKRFTEAKMDYFGMLSVSMREMRYLLTIDD
ncbi:putative FAD binding domain-containing protein [Colletotrichum sublineola]|uniref:Putative FAD binding domain-containing protein n=1 Tax=Colletotrichum sublineola TaxID=1173701 RepID=A0A066X5J9_COLSU|nr:putative FAD binding domain-containing protein [Colletotrichum sublineola]